MQHLVLSQDRTRELRDALGLGRGSGRVKTLLSLADGPLSLGDLAEITGVDAPYTTLIVNELEARGLVTRTPAADDRRRKLVSSDPRRARRSQHRKRNHQPTTHLVERLSMEKLHQLSAALSELNET